LDLFLLERSNIKKAIMTIPYNAAPLSLINYIKDALYPVEIKDNTDTDKDKDKGIQ